VYSTSTGKGKRAALSQTIALAFPMGLSHHARALDGLLRYVREQAVAWSFLPAPEAPGFSILDLKGCKVAGIITTLNTPAEARCAARMGVPVVNVSYSLQSSPVPRVGMDHVATGRLAAEHLLSLGHTRFAFYGLEGVTYSALRLKGFTDTVLARGCECRQHLAQATFVAAGMGLRGELSSLRRWLQRLTRPCAILAVTDFRARMILDACNELGIRVPHEITVMGVDNYPVICEHSTPPLTSVHRNAEIEGYCTGEMLDDLLSGRKPREFERLVPPGEVVVRASTDVVAFEDPRLYQAVTFVRDNLGRPFDLDELLDVVGVSRRWLEYTFARRLGQTPHQYVTAQRVERVKQLLAQRADIKLNQVARETGFPSGRALSSSFRRVTGLSPKEYVTRQRQK
jgi:LacI family transcriptional regulator